jgi:hypothetical protein
VLQSINHYYNVCSGQVKLQYGVGGQEEAVHYHGIRFIAGMDEAIAEVQHL